MTVVYVKTDGKRGKCSSCGEMFDCKIGEVPDACPNCGRSFVHVSLLVKELSDGRE